MHAAINVDSTTQLHVEAHGSLPCADHQHKHALKQQQPYNWMAPSFVKRGLQATAPQHTTLVCSSCGTQAQTLQNHNLPFHHRRGRPQPPQRALDMTANLSRISWAMQL